MPSPDAVHSDVRLELVDSDRQGIKYATLSHCWGAGSPFKLLKSNYDLCMENIEYFALSKNMRDAIEIARRMGFLYLWIDSLCIIQDSEEDWDTESAKMGDVYAGAVCTIASTGSSSADGGCFHERDCLTLSPCKIGVSSLESLLPEWIYIRRDDLSAFTRGVEQSPLNKRGWVVQERLLSPRILHFGEEMIFWECWQRVASELNPHGYIYKSFPEDFKESYTPWDDDYNSEDTRDRLVQMLNPRRKPKIFRVHDLIIRKRIPQPDYDPDDWLAMSTSWRNTRGFQKVALKPSAAAWGCDSNSAGNYGLRSAMERLLNYEFTGQETGVECFSHNWYDIVGVYTRGNLTFATDKLAAIRGIAQLIQRATGYEYVAGLWKETLETDLLWFAAEGPGRRLLEFPPKKDSESSFSISEVSKGYIEEDGDYGQGITSLPGLEDTTVYMAPSWSWASIDGVVALDLLAEDVTNEVLWTRLISVSDVSLKHRGSGETGKRRTSMTGYLEIFGPMSKIQQIQIDDDWSLFTNESCSPTAVLFPDVSQHEDDLTVDTELWCLSCLLLTKREDVQRKLVSSQDIQGLVLRRLESQSGPLDAFQRVGFFTTKRMKDSSLQKRLLKDAPCKVIRLI
jgi:hypothetical protein